MPTDHQDRLKSIKTFPSLVKYLRDELDWPIESDDFEELTFEYTAEELGIDSKNAAKVQNIKRLRPLTVTQPWGVFFIKFEPKKLPVVVLRRILSRLVVKKRASANNGDRVAWEAEDLLFISNYGEGDKRTISFAHFSQEEKKKDLPTLKVLGWDNLDTALHLDHISNELNDKLTWPDDQEDVDTWRNQWRSLFTLRHREVIETSKTLAIKLAELAINIRDRIKMILTIESKNGQMNQLLNAFQQTFIHDLDQDGFADMYAQTISYGLLSSRVTNPSGTTTDNLISQMPVTNPFLKELMKTFLEVGGRNTNNSIKIDFDELGVSEIITLLDNVNIEAVLRDFGDRNPLEDPVIHFYEHFLTEFDPAKRMKRGVFYTPRPVVSFIVRSIDESLRIHFGLEDGLADTSSWEEVLRNNKMLKTPKNIDSSDFFVKILDPATGTGTFLVEVIDLIYKTMIKKWNRKGHKDKKIVELWNEYVETNLLSRIYGYELLMAPYTIAHMKIGLKLYETGYRYTSSERVHVYLTNSLDPPSNKKGQKVFSNFAPVLAREALAVNNVKDRSYFTIVIGNPPYAGHSSNVSRDKKNNLTSIGALIENYKEDCPELFKPAQAKWLQDDYVKFIRFAEHTLEKTYCGILGFITNHSYLNNPTFRGMRKHLITTFDEISLIDLHGNIKRDESNKLLEKDENVFDIQQGVAIQISVKKNINNKSATVKHYDIWGLRESKSRYLLDNNINSINTENLNPNDPYYLFIPQNQDFRNEYESFWKISDIFSLSGDPAPGVVTTHDEFAIAFSDKEIIKNVDKLLASKSEEEARSLFRLCSQKQWQYEKAKRILKNKNLKTQTLKILYRPFDIRYTINDSNVCVHRRKRVLKHMINGENLALLTNRQVNNEFRHSFCSLHMVNDCALSTASKERTYIMPLYLRSDGELFSSNTTPKPNIDKNFLSGLSEKLNLEKIAPHGLPKDISPENIFQYCYALLHSPTYRIRYSEYLKIDFPRIPITSKAELFKKLSELGYKLVSLHILESSILEKTNFITIGAGPFQVEKISYIDNTVWIDKSNSHGFGGITKDVWNFQIGGYKVCQKWLKERQTKGGKNPCPGHILTKEDITHYQKIIVAIRETIHIMKEIDEVIDEYGGWPDAFN